MTGCQQKCQPKEVPEPDFKIWTAQNQTRIGLDQKKNDAQTKLPGLGKDSNNDWARPDWIRFLKRGGTGSRPWGRSPNPDKIKTWTRPDQTNKKTIPRLDYLNQKKINLHWSNPDWIRFSTRDQHMFIMCKYNPSSTSIKSERSPHLQLMLQIYVLS